MQLTINGLEVFSDGEKYNQSILFVHGFPYDHTMWKAQIDYLKSDYYCVSYDIRGLGQSNVGDGQYTMESYVDDLMIIIEELDLKKPVICALSMGGYIAFRAVERTQELFDGLILCDTKSAADSDEGKLVRASKIAQINNEGLGAFVEEFVPTCFSQNSRENKKELLKSTIEKCKLNQPSGVKGALIAMLSRTDTSNYLDKIKIPTLIIVGENDALTPPEVMKEISNSIIDSVFVEIPEVGHMTPLENPDGVNEAINNFLGKNYK